MSPRRERLLFVSLIFGLLFIAVMVRLSHMDKPIWLDEANHLTVTLESTSLLDLRSLSSYLYIPFLEILIRKIFWVPFLGNSINAFRTTSLLYGLMTLVFVISFTHFSLRKQKIVPWICLLSSTLIGLHFALSALQIRYSVEARGYSFMSLISIVWFTCFVFCRQEKRETFFTLLSFLFLNTHFFSIPFVLFAYLENSIQQRHRGNRKESIQALLRVVTILFLSFFINQPAIFDMFTFSRSDLSAIQTLDFWQRCKAGLGLLPNYWNSAGWQPLGIFAPILLSFASLLPQNKPENSIPSQLVPRIRILVLTWVILPLTLISIRSQSAYPFYERYFLVFSGIEFVLLFQAIRSFLQFSEKAFLSLIVLVIAIPLIFNCLYVEKLSFFNLHAKSSIPAYESALAESLQTTDHPILVLASPSYGSDILRYYISDYFHRSDLYHYEPILKPDLATATHSLFDREVQPQIDRYFLQNYSRVSGSTVLLLQIFSNCPPQSGLPNPKVKRQEIRDGYGWGHACLWRLNGIRTLPELQTIARGEHFPVCLWPERGDVDCLKN